MVLENVASIHSLLCNPRILDLACCVVCLFAALDQWPVRLLGRFDPFILAHKDKSWLVRSFDFLRRWPVFEFATFWCLLVAVAASFAALFFLRFPSLVSSLRRSQCSKAGYTAIWRAAGQIAPSVLVHGRMVGRWKETKSSSGLIVDIELFPGESRPLGLCLCYGELAGLPRRS